MITDSSLLLKMWRYFSTHLIWVGLMTYFGHSMAEEIIYEFRSKSQEALYSYIHSLSEL